MRQILLLGLVTLLLVFSSLSPASGTPQTNTHSSVPAFHFRMPAISWQGIGGASPGIGAFASDNASFDNLGVNTSINVPSPSLSSGQSIMLGVFDYTNSTELAGVGVGLTDVCVVTCSTEAGPVAVLPDGSVDYSTSTTLNLGQTYTFSILHFRGFWWNFSYSGGTVGSGNGTYNLGVARAQGVVNQGGVPVGPLFIAVLSINGTTTYPTLPTTSIPWAIGVKLHGSSGSGTTSYMPATANSLPQLNSSLGTVDIRGHRQVSSIPKDSVQVGSSLSSPIAAAYDPLWGNYIVRVLTSVSMTPPTATLPYKQSQNYSAQALDQNSNPLYTAKYAWQASPSSLGTFNKTTGTTVSFTSGTTTENGLIWVNATYNGTKGSHSFVSVIPAILSSVAVSPAAPTVATGGTQTFTANPTCTPTCPTSGITYVWALTSTTLGTISPASGATTTFTAGTTTGTVGLFINATLGGITKQGSTVVTVTNVPPTLTSESVSPIDPTVNSSGTALFTANSTCSTTTCPTGITYLWALTSSKLGSIGSTSGTSVTFTAGTTAGTVGIYVNATLSGSTKEAFTVITVRPPPVTIVSVLISPTAPILSPSGTEPFTATPSCSATCPTTGITYAWALTSSALGSITPATGISTTFTAGTTAGTVGIFVNATLNGTVEKSSTVITVKSSTSTLTSLSLSPTTQSVAPGGTLTFTATPGCSSTCPPSGIAYSWTLTNNAMGYVTGTTASVTFTAGSNAGVVGLFVNATLGTVTEGDSAVITITGVSTPVLSLVTLSPAVVSLAAGTSQIFTASPQCTNGTSTANCPSGIAYSWSLSSNDGNFTPATSSTTTFTAGNSVGVENLTVTATLNGVSERASAAITITPSGSTTSGGLNSMLLLLVIVVIVAVVIVVALVLVMRRKRQAQTIPPPSPYAPYGGPPVQGWQGQYPPAGAPPGNPGAPGWNQGP